MLTVKLYEQLPEEAVRIRKEVFMDEQGFCNEFDEIDKIAFHAVLYEDDRAAATGRMYYDDKEHHCYVIGAAGGRQGMPWETIWCQTASVYGRRDSPPGWQKNWIVGAETGNGFLSKTGLYPCG